MLDLHLLQFAVVHRTALQPAQDLGKPRPIFLKTSLGRSGECPAAFDPEVGGSRGRDYENKGDYRGESDGDFLDHKCLAFRFLDFVSSP